MVIPEIEGEKKETFDKLIELSQVKKQIEAVEKQKESTIKMMSTISDDFDVVLQRIKEREITKVILSNMSDEEITALLVNENNEPITMNVPMDSPKQEMDFKRDFLDMLINNDEYFTKIDAAVLELDGMTEEYNEEVREIFSEVNGDIASFVRKTLTEEQETAGVDSDKAKSIQSVLDAMDNAINLQPLVDLYSSLDPRNTVDDFLRRGTEYMDRFHANCKVNGVGIDLSRFGHVEATFIEDARYHKYPNMLLFLVVKKYAKKKTFTRLDNIFLTQLVVNLQTLLYDPKRGSVLSEEQTVKRDELITNIKRALDLIIPAN